MNKKTVVVNIDHRGIDGMERLIRNNPDFRIVCCGQSVISVYSDHHINFAVFESDKDVNFYEH